MVWGRKSYLGPAEIVSFSSRSFSHLNQRRRRLSYRNQSIDLWSKSVDWFLYDNGLRHERVKYETPLLFFLIIFNYIPFDQQSSTDVLQNRCS